MRWVGDFGWLENRANDGDISIYLLIITKGNLYSSNSGVTYWSYENLGTIWYLVGRPATNQTRLAPPLNLLPECVRLLRVIIGETHAVQIQKDPLRSPLHAYTQMHGKTCCAALCSLLAIQWCVDVTNHTHKLHALQVENDEEEDSHWFEGRIWTLEEKGYLTHPPYLLTKIHIQITSSHQFSCPPCAEFASTSIEDEFKSIWSCFIDHEGSSNDACQTDLEGLSPKITSSFWLNPFSGHTSSRPSGRWHYLYNVEPKRHSQGYFPGLYPTWVRWSRQERPADHDIPCPWHGMRGYAANPRGRRPFPILHSHSQHRSGRVYMLLRRISLQKLHGELFGLLLGRGIFGDGIFQQMRECAAGLHWAYRDVRGQESEIFLLDADAVIDDVGDPSALELEVSWFVNWSLETSLS